MRNLALIALLGLSMAGGAYAAPTDAAKPAVTAAKQAATAAKQAATTAKQTAAAAKQTTTTATQAAMTAKPMASAATTKTISRGGGVKAADRTPISRTCSAQADTKQLHGKERAKFRAQCMKG